MAEHHRRGFLISARPGRYTAMVIMLLAYVLIAPFTGVGTLSNRLLNLFVLAGLLIVVRSAWPSRQMTMVAGLLAFIALLPIFGLWEDASIPGIASHTASLLFTTLVIAAILSQVLTTDYVTLDTVIGAAAVYVLIALLWGTIYALLEFWSPGSFRFPHSFQPVGPTTLVPLMKDTIVLYYSFETLTTLGYGDVIPTTPPARFFSVAEALVGQLYLAILVARFVGMQVSHHAEKKN
jgi:voltage-gated potassium channel